MYETKPRVTTSFKNYTQTEFLKKADQILQCMTGNANFPAPDPTLISVEDAINTYAALLAQPVSKENTVQKTSARTAYSFA